MISDMISDNGAIRGSMPVIYNAAGSSQPGNLKIEYGNIGILHIKVANENQHAYNGLKMKIYRTNLQ